MPPAKKTTRKTAVKKTTTKNVVKSPGSEKDGYGAYSREDCTKTASKPAVKRQSEKSLRRKHHPQLSVNTTQLRISGMKLGRKLNLENTNLPYLREILVSVTLEEEPLVLFKYLTSKEDCIKEIVEWNTNRQNTTNGTSQPGTVEVFSEFAYLLWGAAGCMETMVNRMHLANYPLQQ